LFPQPVGSGQNAHKGKTEKAGFIPLFIIMFLMTELQHKRLYGCRKKRLITGTFFDNHYKISILRKGKNYASAGRRED
jgi:hypothetical protein